MTKILFIYGTRPEAIKLAPVILAARQRPKLSSMICVTGQHRELLDQVNKLFEIRPDFDLNLMSEATSLNKLLSLAVSHIDDVLEKTTPDWVLIQGDTTTVTAASIAAFYRSVKIGHIEAGLRSFDKTQPFPEEVNRRLVSVTADLHFAPTELAKQNLVREGIPPSNIVVTGNTVIDALVRTAGLPAAAHHPLIDKYKNRKIILLTAHRRENFGQPLQNICHAVKSLVKEFANEVAIIFPVHPNPQVQQVVKNELGRTAGIELVEPLDYLSLVAVMKGMYFALSDSGGIQEEAPSLGKPVLVLRNVTERPEGVTAGTNRLIGTDTATIIEHCRQLLTDKDSYERMSSPQNPFGDGHASPRILDAIEGWKERSV